MNSSDDYTEQLIDSIDDFPSLDPIVSRVILLVSDPDSSARMIAHEIAKDAGLAARILRLSNSALFGHVRQISNLEHAVVVLGTQEIFNLVIRTATFDFMQSGTDRLLFERLWRHFVTTATAAHNLARNWSGEARDLAYLGGLLHDIGKVVFSMAMPEEYSALLNDHPITPGGILEPEHDRFGCDHLLLGRKLLEHWNFPPLLVNVAGNHHGNTSESSGKTGYLRLVEIADLLAHSIHGYRPETTELEGVLSELGIDDETWSGWRKQVGERSDLELSI
ncbi:MAG TPA: HDOD domain-containing protein [Bacteroidetes bacterium]|nr:HDOD domain-containing protein [Bacteroidota bacterium]